jgi:hypothetical protein
MIHLSKKTQHKNLTGSLVRFELFNRSLCDDMRLFIEQRHDPFDTLLMTVRNFFVAIALSTEPLSLSLDDESSIFSRWSVRL